MCNFCSNCGADLREQGDETGIGCLFAEIGPYNENKDRYAIEGDILVSACLKCDHLSANVSELCTKDAFLSATNHDD